jgi:membrane-anchored protein YejM (alkaline phosphatase superfamily)
MGVLTHLIDGFEDVATAGGEYAAAKIYSILAAVGLLLVLVFLLVLFFVEPMSATLITLIVIVAAAYVLTRSDSEII